MTNTFFNFTTPFSRGTRIRSEEVNPLFEALETAFDQFPTSDKLIGGADYVEATGSGGLYSATRAPALTTLTAGTRVRVRINHTSPVSPQLNLDNLGFRQIRDAQGAVLPEAALASGSIVTMDYDGTLWRAAVVVATSIPTDGSVTNAKLASAPGLTLKGRSAAGTGAVTDLDVPTARSLLQVAQSATASNDFTAGRGLIVGSGGIAGVAPSLGATNLNTVTTGYKWAIASSAGFTNYPGTSPGVLTVIRRASDRIVQILEASPTTAASRRYTRAFNGTTWSAWTETSIVVASGTDSGTTWVQWSDGRMEMWASITQSATIGQAFFGGFRSAGLTWTFPQTFAATPRVSGIATGLSAAGVVVGAVGTGSASIAWTAFASQSSATLLADVRAVGTWY